jgi:hypothetical protein
MLKINEGIWRTAPTWARYIAQDANGEVRFFERRPHSRLDEGIWYAAGNKSVVAFSRPNWAKSLQERPLVREPRTRLPESAEIENSG